MFVKALGIPDNFTEKLPELKQKTLNWKTLLHSGTKINSISTISFHKCLADNCIGNLILIPALATNSQIDPLMKTVQYWGLTHRYNIFSIDTFLGDFQKDLTPDKIQDNTYPELKASLSKSFKFIQPFVQNKHICAIGHCVSATATTDILNDCVKNQEKLPIQSAIFFAPFPKIPASRYEVMMTRRLQIETTIAEKSGNIDPVTALKIQHMKFVCAMRDFMTSVENVNFEPELMAKWNIPVSFVAAGRDRISPPERVQQNVEVLKQHNNSGKIQYLYIPDEHHNFAEMHDEVNSLISLVKNHRIRTK